MEPVGAKRILERSLQKKNYDILHLMVMVTVKAFQLLKIHIQALQSKNLKMCRTCSETSWLSFTKF